MFKIIKYPRYFWVGRTIKNGKISVAGNKKYGQEFNRKGEVVWACTREDTRGYKVSSQQTALRLANGNNLLNE